MLFVIVSGNSLVGLVVDLGPIALFGLVADIVWLVLNIVGLTMVEAVGLVGLVIDLCCAGSGLGRTNLINYSATGCRPGGGPGGGGYWSGLAGSG